MSDWVVEKLRFVLNLPDTDGLQAELDVFSKKHAGLTLVEVEFPSRDAAEKFETQKAWRELRSVESSVVSSTQAPTP